MTTDDPRPVRSTGKTYGTDGDVTVEATHWPDGSATLRVVAQPLGEEEIDRLRAMFADKPRHLDSRLIATLDAERAARAAAVKAEHERGVDACARIVMAERARHAALVAAATAVCDEWYGNYVFADRMAAVETVIDALRAALDGEPS